MPKAPKVCGPRACARAIISGVLILFVIPLRAPGQNPQPDKIQTENVRPLKPGMVDGQGRIESIVIRGNDRIPASILRKSISIHVGDIYDPAKIERAVTAMRNMGYEVREATSDAPAGTKGGPVVIFYVREKQDAATESEPVPVNPTTPGRVAQQDTSVWVPFTAQRVTRKYGLSTSGRGDIISETRAFTARNKDGLLFIYDAPTYSPSSREHHVGTLEDAATGKTFRIYYDHQLVKVLATPAPDTLLPLRPPTAKEYKPHSPELSLGGKMISGVWCVGLKVVAKGLNYPGGEMWVAPSLNYTMVESTVLNYADNVLMEVHLEDIQVGREPDPEPFRIPRGTKRNKPIEAGSADQVFKLHGF